MKKSKKILESKKRYGTCHWVSFEVAKSIKNAKVISGYITTTYYKILHSVVEIPIMNEENEILGYDIIDYTMNLILPKEDYSKIFGFDEKSAISYEEYLLDKGYFQHFQQLKPYILFRDELMKDFEKNEAFFAENENVQSKKNNRV